MVGLEKDKRQVAKNELVTRLHELDKTIIVVGVRIQFGKKEAMSRLAKQSWRKKS